MSYVIIGWLIASAFVAGLVLGWYSDDINDMNTKVFVVAVVAGPLTLLFVAGAVLYDDYRASRAPSNEGEGR